MRFHLHDMPGHLIRRLHQRSTQVFTEKVRAAGHEVTPVQFATMEALSRHPGIEQAQVAGIIGYDRATIGGVIERLERRGLIRRAVNRRDRRARIVHLTEEGGRMLDALRPVVAALQDDILGDLDAASRRMLVALMARSLGLEEADEEGGG